MHETGCVVFRRFDARRRILLEFDAAVAHIEGILQRDAARLGQVSVIARDKEAWEQDIRPKLQRAFDFQLQAVAAFHDYNKAPSEQQLVKGINLVGESTKIMGELAQPGAVPGTTRASLCICYTTPGLYHESRRDRYGSGRTLGV